MTSPYIQGDAESALLIQIKQTTLTNSAIIANAIIPSNMHHLICALRIYIAAGIPATATTPAVAPSLTLLVEQQEANGNWLALAGFNNQSALLNTGFVSMGVGTNGNLVIPGAPVRFDTAVSGSFLCDISLLALK